MSSLELILLIAVASCVTGLVVDLAIRWLVPGK